ncbi:hypothetical protein jhhlp_005944 [Lomentospora prolificans]|uniref:F-box domain-containing protein n=1 Tax=Lomentospora prolificans TaxID=41688 RepID=A0A2N3N4L5_9PEZI|nr:hypothetical protein jhhlp_005944 [Lomentospora prolificans]
MSAPFLRLRRPAQPGAKPASHPESSSTASASPAPDQISSRSPGPTFMDLPPELHLHIAKYLIYPDALSLKHVNRYFHALVYTGITLKVEWLVQRRSLHLECPNNGRCDLGSDVRFCRGSVALLMKRRREHLECESRPDLGCLIYGTKVCVHRRSAAHRWARWLRTILTAELWWLIVAAIPLLCCDIWILELVRARRGDQGLPLVATPTPSLG